MKKFFDNTMLASYKRCPREFYLRHVRSWRGGGISPALSFGLSWHEAMDVVWAGINGGSDPRAVLDAAHYAFLEKWKEQGMNPEPDLEEQNRLGARTPMVAREMLYHYIQQRSDFIKNSTLRYIERPFAVPIFADRSDIWYIGRLDKWVRSDRGDEIIIEHKTTSEYKKEGGFKTTYLEGWSPSSQIEGYIFSGRMQEKKKPPRYVWIDAALVHKSVHDKFKFIPISHATGGIESWLWEARDWIMRVESELTRLEESDSDAKHMQAFPRNTDSCSGKYGLCSFINVCRTCHNPAQLKAPPEGFIEEKWEPFDTLGLEAIMTKE